MREGTFDYYMREPIVKNDAKGVAPLILAYIETMFRSRHVSACSDPDSIKSHEMQGIKYA